MIYDHTSALCDFESDEQFSVFWRHVATSERCYGMLTIVIEDNSSGDNRLRLLKQCCNFVVKVESDDGSGQGLVLAKEQ
jgi:hypothetical protein